MNVTYVPTSTPLYQRNAGEKTKMEEGELVSTINQILGSHKLNSLSLSNLEELVKHEPLETNDLRIEIIRTIYHLEANRNNREFYSSLVKVLHEQVNEYIETHKDRSIVAALTSIDAYYSSQLSNSENSHHYFRFLLKHL